MLLGATACGCVRICGIRFRSVTITQINSEQFTKRNTIVMKWLACLALAGLVLDGSPSHGPLARSGSQRAKLIESESRLPAKWPSPEQVAKPRVEVPK